MNGKEGLFPSTYVERLAPGAVNKDVATSEKKPYKPFGAAYHGLAAPPPPGQGVNNVGLQEKEGTEAKKDKFGQYKSTVTKISLFTFPTKAYSFLRQARALCCWRCRFWRW